MHGFLPGYNVSGLDTDKWLRLLIPHFVTDSSRQKEKMMYPGQVNNLFNVYFCCLDISGRGGVDYLHAVST